MRHQSFYLCLCVAMGCTEAAPPPREATVPTVDNSVIKDVLTSASESGSVGSGMQLLILGINSSEKEGLKKDLAELEKASQAGQKAKVKQIAAKMLKSL